MHESPREHLNVTHMADVRRKEIVWRIPGLVPAGMLSVLGGEQGTGKGLWVAAQTARLTQAGHTVLLASMEDSPEYVLRPRMQAVGANLELVGHLSDFKLPDDWALLSAAMNAHEPAWLVIDPVSEYMDSLYSSYSDHAVRQALSPLQTIADTYGTAITWIMHLTKGESTKALTRFSGSTGFTALARSAFLLSRDPNGENENARYLAHVKSNVSPLIGTTAWHVEPIYLPADDDEPAANTARLVHDGNSEMTAEGLLATGQTDDERTEYNRAVEIIEQALGLGAELPSEELNRMAEAEGIGLRTMQRARRGRVDAVPKGGGTKRVWYVKLSQSYTATDRPPQGGGGLSSPHGSEGAGVRPPRGGDGGLSQNDVSQSPGRERLPDFDDQDY